MADAKTTSEFKDLFDLAKSKKYVTYDEINELLPEDMLSPEQIDETLMLFDDNGIEVVDEKQNKKVVKIKAPVESKAPSEDPDAGDYGSVTDPVKMYLREMGMVTLLSREGEVEIAKRIEAGEQEVLRALLEATTGVEATIELGDKIANGALRPKHVLRDIDEGDTYNDEVVQTDKFLETIRSIKDLHHQNRDCREKAFAADIDPEEQRKAKRHLQRLISEIFDLLKDWRLEAAVIDDIEVKILQEIEFFEATGKKLSRAADRYGASIKELRDHLSSKAAFLRWVSGRSAATKDEMAAAYADIKDALEQVAVLALLPPDQRGQEQIPGAGRQVLLQLTIARSDIQYDAPQLPEKDGAAWFRIPCDQPLRVHRGLLQAVKQPPQARSHRG